MRSIIDNQLSISKIVHATLTTSIEIMPLSALLTTLNHRHVISSASTNSELITAVQEGSLSADKLHLLTADTQTAGRGQRGRSWQSPPGNIYLSLYHPIQMPVSGLLSLVIGAELAKMPIIQTLNDQLRAQGLIAIGVKWANDLGFYQTHKPSVEKLSQHNGESIDPNKGREPNDSHDLTQPINYFNKLAGILIEPVWQSGKLTGVVMGVGLNVQATPALTTQTSAGMSYRAISLQDIYDILDPINASDYGYNNSNISDTADNNDLFEPKIIKATLPSLQDLYQQISRALITAITCFEQLATEKLTNHTQYTDEFMTQFAKLDALSGLRLRVTQNHNEQLHITTGYACGIDTNGCLQLRQDNGKLSALFTGRIDVINDA